MKQRDVRLDRRQRLQALAGEGTRELGDVATPACDVRAQEAPAREERESQARRPEAGDERGLARVLALDLAPFHRAAEVGREPEAAEPDVGGLDLADAAGPDQAVDRHA